HPSPTKTQNNSLEVLHIIRNKPPPRPHSGASEDATRDPTMTLNRARPFETTGETLINKPHLRNPEPPTNKTNKNQETQHNRNPETKTNPKPHRI
ncbi:MAG: hypothetical protein LRS48_03280, partial [Desulfurococcales archaeon]|nr:hypothetical protein [Desulfurococcales archaeon]